MKRLIMRFKEEGIFENHREYIRAWLSYLDQKRFSKKVEKQMLGEIRRYLATRDSVILDHLVEVVWNETDSEAWIIVVPKNG
jgi:Arc/MetJ-type ribon-helix-helix transcriptional regulator